MSAFSIRKRPVQERSRATVEAILEATARVLLDRGAGALTTSRVAERAGVGIGTLYQYFPSKEALLSALHERGMDDLEETIARAIARSETQPLERRLEALVDALLAYKRKRPELASAIHAELVRIEGHRRQRAMRKRTRAEVQKLLEQHAHELREMDLELTASVMTTAVEGTLTAAVEQAPSILRRPELRDALIRLIVGYLRESGWSPHGST